MGRWKRYAKKVIGVARDNGGLRIKLIAGAPFTHAQVRVFQRSALPPSHGPSEEIFEEKDSWEGGRDMRR